MCVRSFSGKAFKYGRGYFNSCISSSSSELLSSIPDVFYLSILHSHLHLHGCQGYLLGWHHAVQLLIDQKCWLSRWLWIIFSWATTSACTTCPPLMLWPLIWWGGPLHPVPLPLPPCSPCRSSSGSCCSSPCSPYQVLLTMCHMDHMPCWLIYLKGTYQCGCLYASTWELWVQVFGWVPVSQVVCVGIVVGELDLAGLMTSSIGYNWSSDWSSVYLVAPCDFPPHSFSVGRLVSALFVIVCWSDQIFLQETLPVVCQWLATEYPSMQTKNLKMHWRSWMSPHVMFIQVLHMLLLCFIWWTVNSLKTKCLYSFNLQLRCYIHSTWGSVL